MRVNPALVTLFGSETRVRTLAVLAGAHQPLTAYRVAKVGEIPIPKAYEELRRLGKAGLVRKESAGWVIQDQDVARLLRKRLRIRWADDWFAELNRRRDRKVPPASGRAARPPKGWKPRDPERFVRSPIKDEILRRMGLKQSIHG